jgi:predicted transcriptional regulator
MYYMAKETMTVRIQPETRDALDAIATTLDRDRSYIVNEALRAYVETYRWQTEHIQQGLREANAGKFASPADVKKVIHRLRRK